MRPLIIFVHGWPELSLSWRHQLPCFAALGFRAIAPDMRGYGRSSVYRRHEDYARRAHRRGHARAAPGARPREGRVGRARLGQPRRVEPRQPSSRQMRRRRQSVRALLRQGLCSREFPAPRRSGGLPGSAVPGRTVGLPAVLRGELRQGAPGLRGRCPHHREGPVPQGPARRPRASPTAPQPSAGTAAGSAAPARPPTCRSMPMC